MAQTHLSTLPAPHTGANTSICLPLIPLEICIAADNTPQHHMIFEPSFISVQDIFNCHVYFSDVVFNAVSLGLSTYA